MSRSLLVLILWRVLALWLSLWLWVSAAQASALCGFPGRDGDKQASGVVNRWLSSPDENVLPPGSRWLPLGGQQRGDGEVLPGSMALLIQMQGADIHVDNSDAYGSAHRSADQRDDGLLGDGIGHGWQHLQAGHFEFVRIEEVRAGALRIRGAGDNGGIRHGYLSREPNGASDQGRHRWQLVLVPQYENLTLTGDIRALPWDGTTGGVVVLDVRRRLDLNGHHIDVAGTGFRGAAALPLAGALGDASDYYYRAPGIAELAASYGHHAGKGEGLAGTPRWLIDLDRRLDTRSGADAPTASDGYPGGSMARGAPANAGGGASSLSADNAQPAGGGGGGGGAPGHAGADGQNRLQGGRGGAGLAADQLWAVAGGGGGAGTLRYPQGDGGSNGRHKNNAGAGGAGGGIILIRSGRLEGAGGFDVRGANGRSSAHGGGGGGGAGTLMLLAPFAENQSREWRVAGGAGGSGPAVGGRGGAGRVLLGGGMPVPEISGFEGQRFDQLQAEDFPGVGAGYLCRPSGMLLAGQVFEDNGALNGIAHDGVRQRGERGLAGRRVQVVSHDDLLMETHTNASGLFALELPESLAGKSLSLVVDIAEGWQPVAAPVDDVSLAPFVWQGKGEWRFTAQREYLQGGINLGLIREPQWQPPEARTVAPGSTQLFLFRYLPHSQGRVRFRYNSDGSDSTGWRHRFLLDPECNNTSLFLDEAVSRWLPLTPEQPVCLRVRVDVPANAAMTERLLLRLEAETDLGDTPLGLTLLPLKADIELQVRQ